jgi:hypothetical protein
MDPTEAMLIGRRITNAIKIAIIVWGAFEYLIGSGEGVTNLPNDSLVSATGIFIVCTYDSILLGGILSVFSIVAASALLFFASCIALALGFSRASWGGPLNLPHLWFKEVMLGPVLCSLILFVLLIMERRAVKMVGLRNP